MTEKNSRVDCAEADKKTMQAQGYEGWGFWAAVGCPAELPVLISVRSLTFGSWQVKRQSRANYQVKPDRFISGNLKVSVLNRML